MTGIDPTTCKPGEYYLVQRRDYTAPAMRVDYSTLDNLVDFRWVIAGLNGNFTDAAVTVLHRLVPEPEEKVLDVPMQPWEVLREAADIMHPKSHPTGLWTPEERALRDEAKRLEREHRAAQEKAEQDAAREALIEKARNLYDNVAWSGCDGSSWDRLPEAAQQGWLYAAGLLTEAGDES
ncbi:DUF349 domain-containing protein [Gordonia malaquae]|uniref:DUF349 domain-containing protein n=1 Tax=Gordonia malaquae TaxID=410332 RepID=UPI0030C7A06B